MSGYTWNFSFSKDVVLGSTKTFTAGGIFVGALFLLQLPLTVILFMITQTMIDYKIFFVFFFVGQIIIISLIPVFIYKMKNISAVSCGRNSFSCAGATMIALFVMQVLILNLPFSRPFQQFSEGFFTSVDLNSANTKAFTLAVFKSCCEIDDDVSFSCKVEQEPCLDGFFEIAALDDYLEDDKISKTCVYTKFFSNACDQEKSEFVKEFSKFVSKGTEIPSWVNLIFLAPLIYLSIFVYFGG